MKWMLIFMFAITVVLLLLSVFQMVFFSGRKLNKRMQKVLQVSGERKLNRRKMNLLVQLQMSKQAIRDKMVTKKRSGKLERMLARAGLSLKPEEYIMFQWISALLAGGLLFLFTGRILLSLVGVVVGYLLPRWIVKHKERDRMRQFTDSLPDMIATIVGSLRAGFSFPQAMKTVAEESEGPMKTEIEIVLKEMQYGVGIEEALQQLKERMPSEDLDLMIQSVLIQKQIGGNLAVILETIVKTIRERNKIHRDIRTLTAQGRMSGIVIGILPAALGFIIYLIEPKYISAFITNPLGMMLLGSGLLSSVIGFIFIRKITSIEV